MYVKLSNPKSGYKFGGFGINLEALVWLKGWEKHIYND